MDAVFGRDHFVTASEVAITIANAISIAFTIANAIIITFTIVSGEGSKGEGAEPPPPW